MFASCLREAPCLERGPGKGGCSGPSGAGLPGRAGEALLTPQGSWGWVGVCVCLGVCVFRAAVCVCVCVCFQGRNVMISSGFKIAPVEFSVEMNTYRVVTQVIKREKKELLRCHPGSSFRKRSCLCAWGTGTSSGLSQCRNQEELLFYQCSGLSAHPTKRELQVLGKLHAASATANGVKKQWREAP